MIKVYREIVGKNFVDGGFIYKCSVCRTEISEDTAVCPCCGHKIDSYKEEDETVYSDEERTVFD